MKCSKCGESVKDGDMFCHHCGNQVRGTTEKKPDITFAIISVVLGGLSFLFGALFFPISIIGLILGICQKEKTPLKTVGIVLNSIGLFISIIVFTLFISFIVNVKNNVVDNKNVHDFVEDIIEDNIDFDEDKFDALDEDKWNKYESLREGAQGKEMNIEGTWRMLSSDNINITLKDGYLTSHNEDNENNSESGKYEIVSFESNQLFNKELNILKKHFSSNSLEENTYLMKYLSDGDTEYALWVLTKHDDGIEAQIFSLEDIVDDFDNSFVSYVKMAD